MRACILRPRRGEALAIDDRELIPGAAPEIGFLAPGRRDVAQGQPQQLDRGVVGRELTTHLQDLSQPGVDALERVGRVEHLAHIWWKGEERNDVRPSAAPAGDDSWIPLAPGAFGKR